MTFKKNNDIKKINVLVIAKLSRENPYLELLQTKLKSKNVNFYFSPYYRRYKILPIFMDSKNNKQKIAIIHLHWLQPLIFGSHQGRSLLKTIIYALQLLIDLSICKLFGIKIVWTVHNYISHDSPFPKLELFIRIILSKLVNKIIFLNQSAQKEIIDLYKIKASKTCYIPHGHYRDTYKPLIDSTMAKEKLNLPSTGKVYLFFGNLKPYKGIENVLQIWKNHYSLMQESILLIAGKPDSEDYLNKLEKIASEIEQVILYPKFIKDNEINIFFSAADIVILPFQKILNSGSLILAMSYNKPIIAPKLGAIQEVLANANDLLYDADKENGLLEAIRKSFTIDLTKLSQQVAQACDQLDWDSIGEKTFHVYHDLCQIKN